MNKAFQYKVPRRQQLSRPPSFKVSKEKEVLFGQINGEKASAPEERLASAAQRYAGFEFRMSVNGYRGQPGWKELDFLFYSRGRYAAVEVDETEFIHRGEISGQDPDDLVRIDGLRQLGINVDKVIHVDANKLRTKEDAERTARELFA
jgi:hypothetical protein